MKMNKNIWLIIFIVVFLMLTVFLVMGDDIPEAVGQGIPFDLTQN